MGWLRPTRWDYRVERLDLLGNRLGVELFVLRDDLLPFPLAGNKVRKLYAELAGLDAMPDLVITNGSVDSNHCRTLAWIAALSGFKVHLVLHGEVDRPSAALALLRSLGATYSEVCAEDIAAALQDAEATAAAQSLRTHVIPGGCHSARGTQAYLDIGLRVFRTLSVDVAFVASGTGATQGGLVAASSKIGGPRVVGVSVARSAEPGRSAVIEAASWVGAGDVPIESTDEYVAGGYGLPDDGTLEAIDLGWQFGLPLDPTYTGKAFAALIDHSRRTSSASRVLFWHTGGLWNQLASNRLRQGAERP